MFSPLLSANLFVQDMITWPPLMRIVLIAAHFLPPCKRSLFCVSAKSPETAQARDPESVWTADRCQLLLRSFCQLAATHHRACEGALLPLALERLRWCLVHESVHMVECGMDAFKVREALPAQLVVTCCVLGGIGRGAHSSRVVTYLKPLTTFSSNMFLCQLVGG